MKVWINGESMDARAATSIAELAVAYGLVAHTVLIEHNGIALHQREWSERSIQEADRIEFVRVVAGG